MYLSLCHCWISDLNLNIIFCICFELNSSTLNEKITNLTEFLAGSINCK